MCWGKVKKHWPGLSKDDALFDVTPHQHDLTGAEWCAITGAVVAPACVLLDSQIIFDKVAPWLEMCMIKCRFLQLNDLVKLAPAKAVVCEIL